jgi:hypothetical protein
MFNIKKSNIIIILTFIIFSSTALALPVFSGSGNGNSSNPYVITTPTELSEIQYNLSAYYILGNNIDLNVPPYNTGVGWIPIGSDITPFLGELDGKNYTINNLFINDSVTTPLGLFGGCKGIIKNIKLSNTNIICTTSCGSLVGYSQFGYFYNIRVEGRLEGSQAGGIIGNGQDVYIESSSTNMNMIASAEVGGIVDQFGGASTVNNSYSTSNFTGTSCAGFVPFSSATMLIINHSYFSGHMSCDNSKAFILVNLNDAQNITDVFYDSQISNTTDDVAVPKTTVQMKIQTTYTGYDFVNVWLYCPDNYPVLREQTGTCGVTPIVVKDTNATWVYYIIILITGIIIIGLNVYAFIKIREGEFEQLMYIVVGDLFGLAIITSMIILVSSL